MSLEFGLCVLIQGDGRAVFRLSRAGLGGMNHRPRVWLLSLLLIFALLRWIRLHDVVVHGHELFFGFTRSRNRDRQCALVPFLPYNHTDLVFLSLISRSLLGNCVS